MSRTIHVTCGCIELERAFMIAPDDIVWLSDSLDSGPLCDIFDAEGWLKMRAVYWESLRAYGSPMDQRRRSRKNAKSSQRTEDRRDQRRLAEATEIVLWIGTRLADQLALAWMPQWLHAIGNRSYQLWILPFEKTRAGGDTPSLEIVNPNEFRYHPPLRLIEDDDRTYLNQAWNAVVAPDPTRLVRFLERPSSPLPLLHNALRKILWRYPDVRSGLNRYEVQILASTTNDGRLAAGIIGDTMKTICVLSEGPGDNWLFWRLRRLGDPSLPHPALELSGEQTRLGDTEVRLTAVGEQMLRSEANFVELNGIDDWVGGVHLDSQDGNVWFHQEGTLVRG